MLEQRHDLHGVTVTAMAAHGRGEVAELPGQHLGVRRGFEPVGRGRHAQLAETREARGLIEGGAAAVGVEDLLAGLTSNHEQDVRGEGEEGDLHARAPPDEGVDRAERQGEAAAVFHRPRQGDVEGVVEVVRGTPQPRFDGQDLPEGGASSLRRRPFIETISGGGGPGVELAGDIQGWVSGSEHLVNGEQTGLEGSVGVDEELTQLLESAASTELDEDLPGPCSEHRVGTVRRVTERRDRPVPKGQQRLLDRPA